MCVRVCVCFKRQSTRREGQRERETQAGFAPSAQPGARPHHPRLRAGRKSRHGRAPTRLSRQAPSRQKGFHSSPCLPELICVSLFTLLSRWHPRAPQASRTGNAYSQKWGARAQTQRPRACSQTQTSLSPTPGKTGLGEAEEAAGPTQEE